MIIHVCVASALRAPAPQRGLDLEQPSTPNPQFRFPFAVSYGAMELESSADHWQRICRGELCQLCETPLPTAVERMPRYCPACVPSPAVRLHPVMVNVDHYEDWTVHMVAADLVYWWVRVSEDQLQYLIGRLTIAPTQREEIPHALRTWGRTTFHAHLSRREALLFVWACRRDQRNGYEKLNGLRAGASNRRHSARK